MIEKTKVTVIKQKDDPICLRISAGGHPKIGFYVVYRGGIQEAIVCLNRCLKALQEEANAKEN